MTPDLDEIEKACAEATPGPWTLIDNGFGENALIPAGGTIEADAITAFRHTTDQARDAHFIANARQLVPELVAEARRLLAAVAE